MAAENLSGKFELLRKIARISCFIIYLSYESHLVRIISVKCEKILSMDLLVLSRVETTTRTWAMTGVSSYLSRPPVPLLGKELLRFPICGAVVAVALASDDGTVGEYNRHGGDTFTNHCFFWKESR